MFVTAVYPGTFDPFTYGHLDLVKRALRLFPRLVVAVARNPQKTPLFTVEERLGIIREALGDLPEVEVDTYDALTSNRPYRPGLTQAKAEAVLRQGAGTQWDPAVIDAMLRAMPDMIRIRENYQPRRPPARAAAIAAGAEYAESPAAPTAFSLPTTCLTAAVPTQGD